MRMKMAYAAMRVRYEHKPGDGIRSRLAWALRRLAKRVDSVEGITIYTAFDSDPAVPDAAKVNAISQGQDITYRLFHEEVAAASAEEALREQHPELIEEDS